LKEIIWHSFEVNMVDPDIVDAQPMKHRYGHDMYTDTPTQLII